MNVLEFISELIGYAVIIYIARLIFCKEVDSISFKKLFKFKKKDSEEPKEPAKPVTVEPVGKTLHPAELKEQLGEVYDELNKNNEKSLDSVIKAVNELIGVDMSETEGGNKDGTK